MFLKSDAFTDQGFIPQKYSCQGEDSSPDLQWGDIPEGTKSFALSIKDPDAPGGTFVHWMVYDIDPEKREIKENEVPGKQVTNHFGRESYGGPCPPSGVHRYYFKLHALDVSTLGNVNAMNDFDAKVEQHSLEAAELLGKYEPSHDNYFDTHCAKQIP